MRMLLYNITNWSNSTFFIKKLSQTEGRPRDRLGGLVVLGREAVQLNGDLF
jgi:hypothetical protein